MIIAINYADKRYKKKQKMNTFSAKYIGKVDRVDSFCPEDIDTDFYNQYKDVLSQKRGGGLWLWKPFFILKVLEKIAKNDYLIYVDSGALYLKNVRSLIKKMEESNQTIMLFETPLVECQWTKKEVFTELNAYNDEIRFSQQIMSGFILVKKTEKSLSFMKEWLNTCCYRNFLSPQKGLDEDTFFLSHREDQSILSVLAKKEGIIPFNDASDQGRFPLMYLIKDRLFLVSNKQDKYKIDKTYFLLIRNANVFIYFITYCLRLFLNKFNLEKIRLK